jgi:hypothetical protein
LEKSPVIDRHVLKCVFIGVLVGLGGCNDGVTQSETAIPVTGTITLDGKPLEGASVTFIPLAADQGQGGVGSTDAAGKYEVTHFRTGKGLEPGEYRVAISKLVMQDGSPIPAGTSSAAELATKNLLGPQFSDPNSTTLKASVASGGQPIDFALKSQ